MISFISTRSEEEVFFDLAVLCTSEGYIHAIAYFCLRDNFIWFTDKLVADDMEHQRSHSRLIRTEISTLIGLMVKKTVSYALPKPDALNYYVTRTETLLEELHSLMMAPFTKGLSSATGIFSEPDPFNSAKALREPIFYSGDSAYGFQYLHLAKLKYGCDDTWLERHKQFQIADVTNIVGVLERLQNDRHTSRLKELGKIPTNNHIVLPAFEFTANDIAQMAGLDISVVERVLAAFCLPVEERNVNFVALNDFNETNAKPILRKDEKTYVLLQHYSLLEAIYESPFFWMAADKSYAPTALANRGKFTEDFVNDRLEQVFGAAHVFKNVVIYDGRNQHAEIDVLVLFGDHAIVVQAKSKRLTIESRKGNDLQLKDDFKKAIQKSYDQAFACASALLSAQFKLVDSAGREIKLKHKLKAIFPVCIIADHYPALAFQARQFLKTTVTDIVLAPLVIDVFALDVFAEMLNTPLHFLHYLTLRARFGDRFMVTKELTCLSFHLKQNLWIEDGLDMAMLDESLSADLDIAMLARRQGIIGAKTPNGILTRLQHTAVGRLVKQFEARTDPACICLGLLLLQLSEATANGFGVGIEKIVRETRHDRGNHDISIAVDNHQSGVTIHCNYSDDSDANQRLLAHCKIRKYDLKANRWFGLLLYPEDGSIRAILSVDGEWQPDSHMDRLVLKWPRRTATSFTELTARPRKVGRNDPCPCGSGKKHKKCCLGARRSNSSLN